MSRINISKDCCFYQLHGKWGYILNWRITNTILYFNLWYKQPQQIQNKVEHRTTHTTKDYGNKHKIRSKIKTKHNQASIFNTTMKRVEKLEKRRHKQPTIDKLSIIYCKCSTFLPKLKHKSSITKLMMSVSWREVLEISNPHLSLHSNLTSLCHLLSLCHETFCFLLAPYYVLKRVGHCILSIPPLLVNSDRYLTTFKVRIK